jgi:ParB/RepB/Spo0J family partition protein
MSVAAMKPVTHPLDREQLVPKFFDPESIVTPPDNPVYSPAMLDDLLADIREHRQLMPGWIAPSPDLPAGKWLCLEGNRRLAVVRLLGLPFWAFELAAAVAEEERIRLTFSHNFIRRRMSSEEIAERAARFMELTDCTAAEAARKLNVSPPTLSRAFGEKRIPAELKPRADRLGLSIRSLVAAVPLPLGV